MPVVTHAAMERAPGRSDQEEILPASVTVTRTSDEDFKQRQLILFLDDVRIATLLFGDSVTQDVQPGPHRIRVSNTLVWKTVEFTAHPGEQIYYEVINRAGWGTYPMLLIFGVGPLYVTVRRMD
jgi:hypothetical protein